VINFGPTVPPDLRSFGNQRNADCFAWSEFVALNWPLGDAAFGAPMDLGPVAWELYASNDTLFPSDGSKPPPWPSGEKRSEQPRRFGTAKTLPGARPLKFLTGAALKGAPPTPENEFTIEQAVSPPNWLGAQNGSNLWYEIKVNRDEYEYVVQNGLYNQQGIDAFLNNGAGSPIVLPKGCSSALGQSCPQGDITGAIEVKAAWMEATTIDDPSQRDKWSRYKLTRAIVTDTQSGKPREVTLALIGLHIIHKTTSQPTWVWATFEQVDNVPDGNATHPFGYNINNPDCKNQTVTVASSCLPSPSGNVDVTVSCTPNTKPPYNLGAGCPVSAIQTTRTNTLDSTVKDVNAGVQSYIQKNIQGSVWQYYQLVDVIWSTNPTQDPSKPSGPYNPPATPTGLTAGTSVVFNTTMETYAQKFTCTDCHARATTSGGTWFSDFSFLFSTASSAPTAPTVPAPPAP
jgi:hypothetical protein